MDPLIGQKFNDGNLTVVGISERKQHRNKLYLVKCSVCSQDPELFGDAVFEQLKSDIIRNKIPCGCAKSHRYTNEQYRILINRVSNGRYKIISNDAIEHTDQKIRLKCCVDEYEWETSTHSLIGYMKSGCKLCGIRDNANRDRCSDYMSKIHDRCKESNLKFISIEGGEYKNKRSRIVLSCVCGYKWDVAYENFINAKNGCPACADTGYNKSKPGCFYITIWKHEENKFIKYGICANFDSRLRQHRSSKLCDLISHYHLNCNDGNLPLEIENEFNKMRNSIVGKKGVVSKTAFKSFTETLPIDCLNDCFDIMFSKTKVRLCENMFTIVQG